MSEVSKLAPSYIRSIAPYLPGKPISDLAREMGLDPASIVNKLRGGVWRTARW